MTAPPIALILAGPNGSGKTTVSSWALYDNEAGGPVLIASGNRRGEHVLDSTVFDRLRARSSATSRSNDGKLKP